MNTYRILEYESAAIEQKITQNDSWQSVTTLNHRKKNIIYMDMLVYMFLGRYTCIHMCNEYLRCFILSKLYAQPIQGGDIHLEFIKWYDYANHPKKFKGGSHCLQLKLAKTMKSSYKGFFRRLILIIKRIFFILVIYVHTQRV